eukprot:5120439-Pleurochrysis_carterae.AAC.1
MDVGRRDDKVYRHSLCETKASSASFSRLHTCINSPNEYSVTLYLYFIFTKDGAYTPVPSTTVYARPSRSSRGVPIFIRPSLKQNLHKVLCDCHYDLFVYAVYFQYIRLMRLIGCCALIQLVKRRITAFAAVCCMCIHVPLYAASARSS